MQSTNIDSRQLTLTGTTAAPKARARRSRAQSATMQTTLSGSPEDAFLGSRGGLPTRKAQLQAMARAMGLSTDGTIAQLRSTILVGLGRSTPEIQQQRTEDTRQRSRSRRTQRRADQRRSDERRQEQSITAEIEAMLNLLIIPDQFGMTKEVVRFNRDRTDMRHILETILRVFPNTRFLIGAESTFLTITPDNIMRILALTKRIRSGELDYTEVVDQEWSTKPRKSDDEIEMIEVSPEIQVKLGPVARGLRSTGGFFKHINLTHFDLSRYGIYKSEEEIICEDNCLYLALQQGGFPEDKLEDLRITLRTRDIPEYRLKQVCEKFTCRMRVSKKGCTIVYGKAGPTYNIGLLNEHYFINEVAEVTAFAIDNYDEVKNLPYCHNIRAKDGKKWKRTKGDASANHYCKSFHLIEKLLQTKHVRPIEYGDTIMATSFHDKFKQKSGIILKDIPESNFKSKKDKKKPPAKETLRYFFDFETCPAEKNEDGTNANHSSYGVSVHFSDDEKKWFEGDDHVEQALQWMTKSVGKKTNDYRDLKDYNVLMLAHNLSYDIRFLMDRIGCHGVLQKGSKTLTANCSRSVPIQWEDADGNAAGFKTVPFQLKDTACMITMKLAQFGKCFNLDTEKDVMPYKLYTKANVSKRLCTIEEASEAFAKEDKEHEMPQFLSNLNKIGLASNFVKAPGTDTWVHDGKFDIMEYAKYYCEKDTEVLCKGYETFREWILEALDIDIDHQVTISSVSRTYLQNRGCFEGVEQMGGMTREFHKQFMVGGRVMTRENKKVHVKPEKTHKKVHVKPETYKEGSLGYLLKPEESVKEKTRKTISDYAVPLYPSGFLKRKTRKAISDYDAVSLYPSAMARMPGFLKGKPKILEPHMLNQEFLDQQDGYFVHARVTKVGIRRAFPLLTCIKEDGTRLFSNDIEEIRVDKVSLEDLIKFQKVEVEILDGTYYNEGHNSKICEVMKELFELRKQKKAEGNPIQEVYKLVMNSGYGFTMMKAPEYDIQIKGCDEANTFIGRNYNAIHSIVEIGTNKTLVKSHKNIDDHFVPLHCGIEVLSMSKRIMNETMCLAEDIGIPIYYQDTDSMHLPEEDVPKLEQAFEKLYGKKLNGKNLGQFHPDFEIKDADGVELEGYSDVRSSELIAIGKKCYLDILEATNPNGKKEQHLHVRMKGVPTKVVKWTAKRLYPKLGEVDAVRKLYLQLLNGKEIRFDLTVNGTRTCFDSQRDFTVRSRDKFDRKLSFKQQDLLTF